MFGGAFLEYQMLCQNNAFRIQDLSFLQVTHKLSIFIFGENVFNISIFL